MAFLPTNASQVQQFAVALYGIQVGSTTMAAVQADITAVGGLNKALNTYYAVSFGSQTTAAVAASVAANLGLTGQAATDGAAYITAALNAAPANTRGEVVEGIINLFSTLTSNATYGAAATAWNAKVASAVAYTGAADVAAGATLNIGQTIPLTANIDHVAMPAGTAVDHVVGTIDTVSGSNGVTTFGAGDSIVGNGHTVVDLALNLTNTTDAPYSTMSGVSQVNLAFNADEAFNIDAANWGSLNGISYLGKNASSSDITNLKVNNGLGLKIETHTTGDATVSFGDFAHNTVTVDGYDVSASIQNGTGSGTVSTISKAGIDSVLGKAAYFYAEVGHTADNNFAKGAATVGDVTLGHVNLNMGKSASATVSIYNHAAANTHNATVGAITVGDVNLASAKSASQIYLSLLNSATVSGTGNSTAGNITVGNINVAQGVNAEGICVTVDNYASTDTGNATVGNIVAGNVTLTGNGTDTMEVYFTNEARVYTKGNATVGNITVGDVTVTGKNSASSTVSVDNYAWSEKGNATAGDVTLGNIKVSSGDGLSSTIDIYNEAYVSKTGTAKVGNVKVGDVTLSNTGTGSNSFSLYLEAIAGDNGGKGGIATVGNVTVGNINMLAAASSNYATIEAYAYDQGSKTHAVSIGTMTIGNISMQMANTSAVNDNTNYLYISRSADSAHGSASVGNLIIGNVNINGATQTNATNEIYVDQYAYAGSAATIGTVTIGNISVETGVNGYAQVSVYNYASGSTIGDSVGKITVGDVSLIADSNAAASVTIEGYAVNGATGGIKVGNVSLHASQSAYAHLYISETAAGNIGDVSIGNINISIASSNNAGSAACATVEAYTYSGNHSGNIIAGNINLSESGLTAGAAATATTTQAQAYVTLSSDMGNVTVGDITVTGGIQDSGHNAMDNYADLANWLTLAAGTGKTVTVGKIDYSGYVSADTIDVQNYAGAAIIIGGTKGSTINDNKGTNAINVSAATSGGNDFTFEHSQTAVVDAGGAITAVQTAMDSITGIHAGDTLTLDATAGSGLAHGGSITWAQFLLNAEHQIHDLSMADYYAVVGGNTYIAMATTGNVVGEIVEVMGVHTFSGTGGVLTVA